MTRSGSGLSILARALERGLVSRRQCRKVIAEHARLRADGQAVRLRSLLVQRGLLRPITCWRLSQEESEAQPDLQRAALTLAIDGAGSASESAIGSGSGSSKSTYAGRPSSTPPVPRRTRHQPSTRPPGPRPGQPESSRPRPGPGGKVRLALPSTSSRLPIAGVKRGDSKIRRSHPLRDDPEQVEREVFESELPGLEITERIGRGGMGMVFRARQRLLDRDVAVKVIPFRRSPAPELVRRFNDEARLAARLRHPGVAWVLAAGSTPRFLYLVLEHISGRDLALELLERRTIPELECLAIAEQISWALDHAHQRGVVHQDLKPANVILRPDGHAVVTDFGLAASLDGLGGMVDHPRLFGTLPFLPPEDLRRGRRVPSAGADLYALGVTLFRMLTGRLPYASTSVAELVRLTANGPPRAVVRRESAVSDATQRLLARVMAPAPQDRFSSARELAETIAVVCSTMHQGGDIPRPDTSISVSRS